MGSKKEKKKPGGIRLTRKAFSLVLALLLVGGISAVAYAAQEAGLFRMFQENSDYEYTTKGYTWVLVSETTDEATGVTTTTYGMDTDDDGVYNITLVQTGNEWTYYFSVYDDSAEYYVTEVLNNDLDKRYTLEDENGNQILYAVIDSETGKEAVLYNVEAGYGMPDYGDLSLTKTLTDAYGMTVEGGETLFAFDVSLSYQKPGEDGEGTTDITPLLVGTQSYGEVSFTWTEEDGFYTASARVYLTGGQTVNMTGIPAGVEWSIREITEGYTTSWSGSRTDTSDEDASATTLSWENAPSGTIEKSQAVSVVCKNVEPGNPPPGPETELGTVIVEKAVQTSDGEEVTEDETNFSYRIVFGGLTPGESYGYIIYNTESGSVGDVDEPGAMRETAAADEGAVPGYYSYTALADGSAVVDFQLENGWSAVFEDLPVGCTYQVLEYAVEGYTASYEIVNYSIVSSSKGENFEANQDLTTGKETLDEGETNENAVTVRFTNTRPAPEPEVETIRVKVEKVWADGNDHTGDEVTIFLMRAESPEDMENNYGDLIQTITLDGTEDPAWEYTFTDLTLYQSNGQLYYYYVREQPVDGYYTGIEPHYVSVTDDNGEEVPDYTQDYSFTVTNRTSRELPVTGSPGATLYAIGGLLLLTGAATLLLYKNKKRRKEDSASS